MKVFAGSVFFLPHSSPLAGKGFLASLKVRASGAVTGCSPTARCALILGVWGTVSRRSNVGLLIPVTFVLETQF